MLNAQRVFFINLVRLKKHSLRLIFIELLVLRNPAFRQYFLRKATPFQTNRIKNIKFHKVTLFSFLKSTLFTFH